MKKEGYYNICHPEVTVACNLIRFREGNYCIPEAVTCNGGFLWYY